MIAALTWANVVRQQQNANRIIKKKENNMIYLGVFYRDNGRITVKEFTTLNEIRKWWKENKNKYLTYDIYISKCINNKIKLEDHIW